MARDGTTPFPVRTARFRQVVERCGHPDVHLSLVAPAQDRVLQDLNRHGRIMTIRPAHRGAGTDYGVVGIFGERGVQFLAFGRSLRAFADKRIVGLDYSLVNDSAMVTGEAPPPRTVRKQDRPGKPPPAPPQPAKLGPKQAPTPRPKLSPKPLPAKPPALDDIRSELHKIQRLLAARRFVAARKSLDELVERMRWEARFRNQETQTML